MQMEIEGLFKDGSELHNSTNSLPLTSHILFPLSHFAYIDKLTH